jgi:hypothetical protein
MADGYQAVGAMVAPIKSPDTFGQLSNILGIQQQRTALQNQALELQQNQIKTQAAQDNSNYFSDFDPTKWVTSSGTTDVNGIMGNDPNYRKLTGAGKVQVTQNLQAIQGKQLENMAALSKMDQAEVENFAQSANSLTRDPNVQKDTTEGRTAAQNFFQTYGLRNPEAKKISDMYSKAVQSPELGGAKQGHLLAAIQAIGAQGQTVSAQQPKTQNVDQGATIAQQTVDPATGQPTTVNTLKKNIPPGYQMINGQLVRVSDAGLSIPKGPPSSEAPPVAGKLPAYPRPPVNAPPGDTDRYNKQMADNREHVASVSAAANDTQNGVVPTRYRNDQIESILNDHTFSPTGPGAAQLNWIASKLPGAAGDDFQKLGHYLAQNNAAIAQKMGVPNTNLGAETAAAGSGNTSQNKGALLEITKVNDAMNTGLDLYNQGLSKLTNNGADPSKVAAYRNAFGKNYDVNVLRYDDAVRRGDRPEIDSLTKKMGAQGMQAMGAKRKVLHSLADTGDLP